MNDIVISTPAGTVRGVTTDYCHAFRGIPYAEAPEGIGRFLEPVPRAPWSGTRDATDHSASAPQPERSRLGTLDLSPFFAPGWRHGSDYLTVSVQTPDPAGHAPVVVYLHGGAFIAGSNASAAYDGATFVRDGIVFVGVNYRLGIPGFLRLPNAPDNRGLLDVIAALQWVQGSIAAFGGDPDRVTVMGQSAGAILVMALAGRTDTEGLFAQAIAQSGTAFGGLTIEQADRVTAAVSIELKVPATAAALAEVTDEDLLRASVAASAVDLRTATARPPMDGIVRFGVVTELNLLGPLATGPASYRPLLLGSALDEAALYPDPAADLPDNDALVATTRRLSDEPDAVLDTYRREFPALSAADLRLLLRSDAMFSRGTRKAADVHARAAATFVYEFTWRSTSPTRQLGASHLMDLPFVFDDATRPALRGEDRLLGTGPIPPDLATRMHRAWVAFMRTGDPGWAAYETSHRFVQLIGDAWTVAAHHRSAALDAWRSRPLRRKTRTS